MEKWKKRTRPIQVTINDTPIIHKCEVCGSKIVTKSERRYTAIKEPMKGGIANALSGQTENGKLYDCFDCPVCGCQFIAKKRLRKEEEE